MKQKHQKQYAGVWLDTSNAYIITNNPESEDGGYSVLKQLKAVDSHSGGSEHTMNNARQGDELKYYKSLSTLLLPYDEILVFGPGKAQEHFQNHLHDDAQFKNKQISIDSAEHLTNPQMIAKVRDFFKTRQA